MGWHVKKNVNTKGIKCNCEGLKQKKITQQKEKCQLIQCFGPMFIDFDDYPHFSGKESIIFVKDINEAIKCEHGYAYSADHHPIWKWVDEKTWDRLKKYFPDATEVLHLTCRIDTMFRSHVHWFWWLPTL